MIGLNQHLPFFPLPLHHKLFLSNVPRVLLLSLLRPAVSINIVQIYQQILSELLCSYMMIRAGFKILITFTPLKKKNLQQFFF